MRNESDRLRSARVLIALGQIAHQSAVRNAGGRLADYKFGHLAEHALPDGRTLIYVGKGASGGVPQLHLRRMDRLDDVALAGTEGAIAPFFSAGGGSVAFFAGGLLKKVTLGDGEAEASLAAQDKMAEERARDAILREPAVVAVLSAFPDATLESVSPKDVNHA